MKRCPRCKETKEIALFYDGQGYCKPCMKSYYKKHYIDRTTWIQEEKAKPCVDCGNVFHYSVMQFDHRPDETKSFTISQAIARSTDLDTLLEEMAKCDLVCANCHAYRTWQRINERHEKQTIQSEGNRTL